MKLYIGMDIGLAKTALCAIGANGETVFETVVASEPAVIISKLSKYRESIELIGLEACPLSEWLHRNLSEDGFQVFCLETRHTQRFLSTRPNKTDRTDAHGIANMMRLGHFKPVHVKSQAAQLTRALLTGRRQFMTSILQTENTIRSLLRIQGLKVGNIHRDRFSERVYELCEDIPQLLASIEPLLKARDTMRSQMLELNRAIEKQAKSDPICKLFMTIPGVGPLTSLAFKATIDDPLRFNSSKLVPAHLGLTPRVYQSGEIDRSGHITKSGDNLLRYHLVNAAASMLLISGKWCSLKSWGVRLAQKKGKGKAIVAVARKIAIVMHRMWLTGEPYRFGADTVRPETPVA